MIFNQTEKEEKAYLMDIIALLAANIEQMDKAIEDKSKDVMEHKLYLWENLSELDRAEKSAVRQIVTQQVAASESLAEKKKRYRKMMAIPYFGRIDFQEKGQPEVLPLYIGIHSFFNPPTNENLIHDWRAPISSMFYDYELGEAHFDAPSGEVKGNIRLKRQYRIRDGKMEFMLESSLNIQDDILQKELSGNSDDRMKNIVATIQREQNKIIRNDTSNTLIIQGVAGSGKTSIALHRVAYLLYRHKGEITSNDILIISPNKVFADYISNVLPELGEEPDIVVREDGSCLVDGQCSFYDFLAHFDLEGLYNEYNYNTLSGLILGVLEHIPTTGEKFQWQGFEFEIVDMDSARIDKVLATRINDQEEDE